MEETKPLWFGIPVGSITPDDGLRWHSNNRRFPIGTQFYAKTPADQGDCVTLRPSTQVGGEHYLACGIQPFEYSMANKLDAMQHTIIKYVTRFRNKNGVEDLMKARDTIDKLIQWEQTHATKES